MSKLKLLSDSELIANYNTIVDSYNDAIKHKDSRAMKDFGEYIQKCEAELIERGLVTIENEDIFPKLKAQAKAPLASAKIQTVQVLSNAKKKEQVQSFTPEPLPKLAGISLKISAYFLPKSRFSTFQSKVQEICRLLSQYHTLKDAAKIRKRDKYLGVICSLRDDAISIVKSSVKAEYQRLVMETEYKVWKNDFYFSLSNINELIKKLIG